MRRFIMVLILGGVWFHISLWAQSDILNKTVTLQYTNLTIREILNNIQQEYGVRFSYLNNEIPSEKKINLTIENEPLYKALDKIFTDTPIGYQVVSGQVILKKVADKETSRTETSRTETSQKENEQLNLPAKNNHPSDTTQQPSGNLKSIDQDAVAEIEQKPVENTATDETTETVPVSPDNMPGEKENVLPSQPIEKKTLEEERSDIQEPQRAISPVEKESMGTSVEEEKTTKNKPKTNKKSLFERMGASINRSLNKENFDQLPSEPDAYERKPFHIGIIYPLSTNGTEAGKYVNKISLHWFAGYAAGLEGFEASGFGNIENDFVQGAQFAGFFNFVKNDVGGGQFAGFTNLNGGYTKGAQFAGFLNVVADSVEAGQFAGFANVNTGKAKGAQVAGFMNVTTNNINAGQFAGFINYAHQVNGAQLAGFANVAIGDVNGFQGSGFINVARNVKGVQLSIINLADSIDGVPIGLLSIVRKNGYRKLEVWGSEALQANVAFKIGVEKFYNIFAFGTQFSDDEFRWGGGLGFGSQLYTGKILSMNLDLLSFYIREEDDKYRTENIIGNDGGNLKIYDSDLNMLNSLRLGLNFQLANHLGIFVAPTFNVMVSEVVNTETGEIGSNLAPSWTVYDKTFNNRTNVKMWPGFHVGLRF